MEPKIIASKAPVKFTESEINEINSIRDKYTENVLSLGQVLLQQKELSDLELSLTQENRSIKELEKKFLKEIVSKYGEGTFDPATGIFTPKVS